MLDIVQKVQGRLARFRLERRQGVTIAPDARVVATGITMHPGCRIRVGRGSVVEARIDLEREGAEIVVGDNSYVGASFFKCAERIEVGSDVEIAWNCWIVDHDWESLVWARRRVDMREWYRARKDWSHVRVAPVTIGDRALVGFNAVILKGVRIGEGAVVGVHSVVTKDVPPYTVVAGVPARAIGRSG